MMNLEVLKNSMIGRDLIRLKDVKVPSIDEMLDYRKNITNNMGLDNYPTEWFQYELDAIDEILRIISK